VLQYLESRESEEAVKVSCSCCSSSSLLTEGLSRAPLSTSLLAPCYCAWGPDDDLRIDSQVEAPTEPQSALLHG
jgi:hypothetical protein